MMPFTITNRIPRLPFIRYKKNRQSRLGEKSGGDRRNGRATKKGATRLGFFGDHLAERQRDQFDPLRAGLQLTVAPLLNDPYRIHSVAT